ncbi:unnamed protein product [Linum tenue]|uniref:Uncharacterized protein n=1 Tax=Linum tenue TaxID=586396 RepID=A0AAV0NLY9_9ROSI|nr:unnamed protein product [Linum tenue]
MLAANWLSKLWPIKTVGPTIPSMYLNKQLSGNKDYGLSIFKSNCKQCMDWLDNKRKGSVIYVSFGSMASLGPEQMEELSHVLDHHAVGCFVTHCGWNSTLEALSLGVPMVAMPQWTDQGTNAKYIEDVWKIGVRAEAGEDGIVKRGVVEKCLREVMEGKKGEEMKSNAKKWKRVMEEAVSEGGSSNKNINEFVDSLIHKEL